VAARAHLEAGGEDPIAICIAAEAAAVEGRTNESRDLMDRLGPPDPVVLDALFAGLPRRGFWPSPAGGSSEADTLFGHEPPLPRERGHEPPRPLRRESTPAPVAEARAARSPSPVGLDAGPDRAVPGPREVLDAVDGGLWSGSAAAGRVAAERVEAEPGTAPGTAEVTEAGAPPPGSGPRAYEADPVAELILARQELPSDPDRALLRLSLVLRMDPTLAPVVLDVVAGRNEPPAAMLRGDALRLLGRHLEAEAAYARAADPLDHPPSRSRSLKEPS